MNRTFKIILRIYLYAAIGLLAWGVYQLATQPHTRSLSFQAKSILSTFGPSQSPPRSKPQQTKPWVPREKHVDEAVSALMGVFLVWGLALLFLKLGYVPSKYGHRTHRKDQPLKFYTEIVMFFLVGLGFLIWAAKTYRAMPMLLEGSWLEKWTRWPVLANVLALAIAGGLGMRIGLFVAIILRHYFSGSLPPTADSPSWRWRVPCTAACGLLLFYFFSFLLRRVG